MTVKFRLFILTGFFIYSIAALSPTSWATEEQKKVYTIREAVQEAIENNWSLKAKEEDIVRATELNKRSFKEFFPKFSTSYSYTRYRDKTRQIGNFFIPQAQNNYAWTTGIRQPLFTGFRLTSQYELTKLQLDVSKIEVELEKLDLALKVKDAYFNILIQDRAVEVAQKDVESRQSQAEVARNFYKVGMIPINELLQAEVSEADARQILVRVQNDAELARSAFNQVLARPTNDPVDVVDVQNFQPETGSFEEYLAMALQERPEIMAIDTRILQKDQETRLAKSSFYPDISLVMDYTKQGDTPNVSGGDFHDPSEARAFAVLNWTFFEWGKDLHTVREVEAAKRQLEKTRQNLVEEIGLQVRQVLLSLKTAETNIPTTKKAVEQGEENVRVSDERYKAQVTTITEVLDAQTRLSQARVNYYRSLYTHHLASAQLMRVLGRY